MRVSPRAWMMLEGENPLSWLSDIFLEHSALSRAWRDGDWRLKITKLVLTLPGQIIIVSCTAVAAGGLQPSLATPYSLH